MQFLVCVDSSRDVVPFKEAMGEGGLRWAEADRAWVASAEPERLRPAQATYFEVSADSEHEVQGAVHGAARSHAWPSGTPFVRVLDQRPGPSYPA